MAEPSYQATPPPAPSGGGRSFVALIAAAGVVVLAGYAVLGGGGNDEGAKAQKAAPVASQQAAVTRITSSPKGAGVYVGSQFIGETPMEVQLPPDMDNYKVVLKAEGHLQRAVVLKRGQPVHAVLSPERP